MMTNSDRAPRIADRLGIVARSHFVGRVSELALFQGALQADDPAFVVLFVHGPGGIGKTTLLHEFALVAHDLGVPTYRVDGRSVEPSPDGFQSGLHDVLGLGADERAEERLERFRRAVIVIDTYELLRPIDGWLRESFLPDLPAGTMIVIAGRDAPDSAWRTTPGWREWVRSISLRNLHPHESETYLTWRGVADNHHPQVLRLTHGHPLALALLADTIDHASRHVVERLDHDPDVLRVLLERFVRDVPSSTHRRALEICAHARVTTEALLTTLLGEADAFETFAWLRSLSFIEQGTEGIYPHDLVRDVLDADFRWRNPAAYEAMHRHIRDDILARLHGASLRAFVRISFELFYMHRLNPVVADYYSWSTFGSIYPTPATPDDHADIVEMVRHHEGEDAVAIIRHWLGRQPDGFWMTRGHDGHAVGFIFVLVIENLTDEDRAVDPAMDPHWAYMRRHGPLRPGERALHVRSWMDRDGYQITSPTNDLVGVLFMRALMTNPTVAWSFCTGRDPEFWEPYFSYLRMPFAAEACFTVGEYRYGSYVHDWRAEPFPVWLDLMREMELSRTGTPSLVESAPPTIVVLSRTEFDEAVKQALKDFTTPKLLATSPLLRSRALTRPESSDGTSNVNTSAGTPERLQNVLIEAVATLKSSPKDQKFYRALHRTYLQPVGAQERVAEMLDLPFGTYRYHLATGTARVADWLWDREVYGA